MNFYTGIGSRKTPFDILILMAQFANIMEKKGFILRSGAAAGADSAFEFGLENLNNAEIYAPYESFLVKMKRNKDNPVYIIPERDNKSKYYEANMIIDQNNLHPAWKNNLADYVRKLHNRNVFQVLGKNLNAQESSRFVMCYTEDGVYKSGSTTRNTGGTGTAIRVSGYAGVPVYNLKNKEHKLRVVDFIKKNWHLINHNHIDNIVFLSDFNPRGLTVAEFKKGVVKKNKFGI